MRISKLNIALVTGVMIGLLCPYKAAAGPNITESYSSKQAASGAEAELRTAPGAFDATSPSARTDVTGAIDGFKPCPEGGCTEAELAVQNVRASQTGDKAQTVGSVPATQSAEDIQRSALFGKAALESATSAGAIAFGSGYLTDAGVMQGMVSSKTTALQQLIASGVMASASWLGMPEGELAEAAKQAQANCYYEKMKNAGGQKPVPVQAWYACQHDSFEAGEDTFNDIPAAEVDIAKYDPWLKDITNNNGVYKLSNIIYENLIKQAEAAGLPAQAKTDLEGFKKDFVEQVGDAELSFKAATDASDGQKKHTIRRSWTEKTDNVTSPQIAEREYRVYRLKGLLGFTKKRCLWQEQRRSQGIESDPTDQELRKNFYESNSSGLDKNDWRGVSHSGQLASYGVLDQLYKIFSIVQKTDGTNKDLKCKDLEYGAPLDKYVEPAQTGADPKETLGLNAWQIHFLTWAKLIAKLDEATTLLMPYELTERMDFPERYMEPFRNLYNKRLSVGSSNPKAAAFSDPRSEIRKRVSEIQSKEAAWIMAGEEILKSKLTDTQLAARAAITSSQILGAKK